MTSQPAGLAFSQGPSLRFETTTALQSGSSGMGFDVRLTTGGSGSLATAFLLQSDPVEHRLLTGYSLAFGVDSVAVGATWRTGQDPLSGSIDGVARGDVGVIWRATNLFGVGYDLGRERRDGRVSLTDHTFTVALRDPRDRLGVEVSYLVSGASEQALETRGQWRTGPVRLFAAARMPTDAGDVSLWHAGVSLALGPASLSTAGGRGGGPGTDVLLSQAFELSSRHETGAWVDPDRLLRISFGGPAEERPTPGYFSTRGREFTDVLLTLDRVAREDRLAGVYVELRGITSGAAQIHELRQALLQVRASGKHVVAYLDSTTIRDLYVASAADWVVASPSLQLLETGIGVEGYYLAELLANLGIEAEFVRTGPYKSAPERYLRSEPSQEARQQLDAYLEDIYAELHAALAERCEEEKLDALLAHPPMTAAGLKECGLVQEVGYDHDVKELYRKKFGRPLVLANREPSDDEREPLWRSDRQVAVLHIQGEITLGRSTTSPLTGSVSVGSDTIVAIAEALRTNPDVAGVIVRIESPGGSAQASDEIAAALKRLSDKKPTVVSMASVAASGGYYVASIGAPIEVTPLTLTGSIGVYAGTFAIEGLTRDLGIGRAFFERGGRSDYFDLRRWDDADRAAVERSVDLSYDRFTSLVSGSRGLSPSEVLELAGGRIWSGSDAVERDLADGTGGFMAAWNRVLDEADLTPERARVVHYPRVEPLFFASPLAAGIALRVSGAGQGPDQGAVTEAIRGMGLAPLITALEPMLRSRGAEPLAHLDLVWSAP